MLVDSPAPYRPRRRIRNAPTAPPLTLVSADYNESDATLTLQFDRAINSAGINTAAFTLHDGLYDNTTYHGASSVTVINPTTIQLSLIAVGSYSVAVVTMDATPNSGIVAMNNGGTWPGATNLILPFA
jgi:uncharacterized protein (DUF2141 family)